MASGAFRCSLIAASAPLLFIPLLVLSADYDFYCGIKRAKYLAGDINPLTAKCFSSLENKEIPTLNRTQYLRKEALSALKKLYAGFKKDNPGVPFIVRSSTRNFYDQKYIWETKWDKLAAEKIKGRAAALAILQYSSMPGTSRHHWGTDIDINELNNRYYEQGPGKVVLDWMNAHAHEYGFCRPYTADREKGYAEERWHWSYKPLSSVFLKGWNAEYANNKKFFILKDFRGSIHSAGDAAVYVNSINGECL